MTLGQTSLKNSTSSAGWVQSNDACAHVGRLLAARGQLLRFLNRCGSTAPLRLIFRHRSLRTPDK